MTMPRWQTGTVDSFGEQIYYEVTGADDAPAIVLTHGAGGSHAAWYQQVPVLADAGLPRDHVGLPRLRQLHVHDRRARLRRRGRRHGSVLERAARRYAHTSRASRWAAGG